MLSLNTDWIWKGIQIRGIYNLLEWSPLCKVKNKRKITHSTMRFYYFCECKADRGVGISNAVDRHLLTYSCSLNTKDEGDVVMSCWEVPTRVLSAQTLKDADPKLPSQDPLQVLTPLANWGWLHGALGLVSPSCWVMAVEIRMDKFSSYGVCSPLSRRKSWDVGVFHSWRG